MAGLALTGATRSLHELAAKLVRVCGKLRARREKYHQFLASNGYQSIRFAGDRWIAVSPCTFGNAKIIRGKIEDMAGYDEEWMYGSHMGASGFERACLYLDVWTQNGGTEPVSWVRHKPSNRRRIYGTNNADIEYVEYVEP